MGATFEKLVDMALMRIKVERKRLRLMKHKTRKCGPRKNNNNKRRAVRTTKLQIRGNVVIADARVM